MNLFTTDRLYVKHLDIQDKTYFIELLSDPDIINQVPQTPFTDDDILNRFHNGVNLNSDPLSNIKNYWGVYEIGSTELIGLTMLLTNDEGDRELGYRFRKIFWGKGYGKEIAKGTIHYCFNRLNLQKLTADADTRNIGSNKILTTFMSFVKELIRDGNIDRRYQVAATEWENLPENKL